MFVPAWMIGILVLAGIAADRYVAALRAKLHRMERLLESPSNGDDVPSVRDELERQRAKAIETELQPHWWP